MNTSSHAKIFKALSDENRLKILLHIQRASMTGRCEGDCNPDAACITDISSSLDITAPTVSHHIKELVNAGLITTSKKGRWVYCRVNQEAIAAATNFIAKFKEGT